MERKCFTIRDDQSKWVDEAGITRSQLVREAIDDRMEATDTLLADAYQANAAHAAGTNTELRKVSTEASERFGHHRATNERPRNGLRSI